MFSKYDRKDRIQSVYCYPDTEVYLNHFGIKDNVELSELEADLTAIRLSELSLNQKRGKFGVAHLKNTHKYIFQDIYPFAGKLRVENISKGDTQFCLCQYIESNLESVLGKLKSENYLANCPEGIFIEKMAFFMAELNMIHPFREGNGRAIREFLRQMAFKNGYELNWHKVDSGKLLEATILAVDFERTLLEVCIKTALEPRGSQ